MASYDVTSNIKQALALGAPDRGPPGAGSGAGGRGGGPPTSFGRKKEPRGSKRPAVAAGPAACCSPRHEMPCNTWNEDSKCVG